MMKNNRKDITMEQFKTVVGKLMQTGKPTIKSENKKPTRKELEERIYHNVNYKC